MGVRKYGLVGIALVVIPLLAVWLLTTGEPEGDLELSPEEWAQASAAASAAAGLAEAQSGLSIFTYPDGAQVRLDFDSVGVTPLDRHALAAGTYLLSIAKEGYVTYDTLLTIEAGQRPRLHLALQAWGGRDAAVATAQVRGREEAPSAVGVERRSRPTASMADRGTLQVTSPAQAGSVWIDGQHVGETPLAFEGVPAGPHTVEVRAAGGKTYVANVEVEPGATATVQAAFTEALGTLAVLVQPWGAIYIDGQLRRQDTDVQYRVELPVGTHEVRVEHPVLGDVTREVEIEAGTLRRLVIDMNEQTSAVRISGGARSGGGAASIPTAERSTPPEPEGGVYTVVDEPPVLIGGLEALHRQARYPERAHTFEVEGRVFLQFVVDEEGRVQDPVVTRGVDMGLDEEALRVVRQARFVPGKVGGRPVRVRHALSINFQMEK